MTVQTLTVEMDDVIDVGGCCPVSGLAIAATEHAVDLNVEFDDTVEIADPLAFVQTNDEGACALYLMVENMSCAACIMKIERSVLALPEVSNARVNMSTRRLVVEWHGEAGLGREIVKTVTSLGYPVAPYNPELLQALDDKEQRHLLSAMAVAGFAASNVMLLSIAVWAGAFSDMGEATRGLFHWVSALIALPAVAYSGQPFFRSALTAIRSGHTNMDIPISLAVIMASGISLHQTIYGGEHAYFDASVSLLFFLLIGRYLDMRARSHARNTAEHLLALNARAAVVLDELGRERSVPVDQLKPGMILLVAAGQRVAADGLVIDGISEVDASLLNGESLPVRVTINDPIYAGTLNVGNPLRIKISAVSGDTLLGEIVRLVEAAEQGRAKYVRIAERASRRYVPIVHAIAAATFIGWFWLASSGWEPAMMAAVAVLIITCPCALALAVPVVQVVATGALLKRGIIVKSADALERLAECDYVVFDKTGTLSKGQIELLASLDVSDEQRLAAAALARHSRHPLSQALVKSVGDRTLPEVTNVNEFPGMGMSGFINGQSIRLGRADWVLGDVLSSTEVGVDCLLETWMLKEGEPAVRFAFSDQLRDDAETTIAAMKAQGIEVELLSGDRAAPTEAVAKALGIARWRAEALPAQKVERLKELAAQGHRVLMVGDGLNDAPALASGHASISPATAADISQTAAHLLFQGDQLAPVLAAIKMARQSDRVVRQNLALAIAYNVCAVPLAIAGLATPLVAAIAMSSSSLMVTLNALRLKRQVKG